ncbi:MAG: erythrose-4-phosphate dehydrogenase [Ectothiorhodospiraceae bacterium]|nr:erythrose-4-phosphate dehydrogenase [Ectothiorhodospiraceae bacterium]MCH8502731.1 erythrose-4-phosphate dehydrogenase [Ectothiorhodospiraceae bacterium]
MIRLAINGYGRIGRCVLRALYETGRRSRMQVVAINEPSDLESVVHLTRFDSNHGRFPGDVEQYGAGMLVEGDSIRVSHADAPEALDWSGIDLLLDCSGSFGDRATAQRHLDAGAPRLLVSNPMHGEAEADFTVIMGVNDAELREGLRIVSNASCTTNCIVPVLQLIHDAFGIEAGSITTVHSAMNDQPVLDGYHRTDLRRTRSAMNSIVPVSTGLARGIDRLLPELAGRIQAHHLRVPTANVSALDTCLLLRKPATAGAVNGLLREAAEGRFSGIMAYTEMPHASCDFNHDAHSSVVDGTQTRLSGDRLLHLMAWFDNEWSFANRMLDVTEAWLARSGSSSDI